MSSIKPGISFPPFNIESDEVIPWPGMERLLDQKGFSDEEELLNSWEHVHEDLEKSLEPEVETAKSEVSTGSNGTLYGAMEELMAQIFPSDEPGIEKLLAGDENWFKLKLGRERQLFSTENTTASISRENQFKNEIETWTSLIREMVEKKELAFPVKILATAELKGSNLPTSNIVLLEYVENEPMLDKVLEAHFTEDKKGFKRGMFLSKNAELEASYVLKMRLIIMEHLPHDSKHYCFVIPSMYTFLNQSQEEYYYIREESCLAIKKELQELMCISGYPLEWLCNTNQTDPKTEKPAYIYEELRNMPYYLK